MTVVGVVVDVLVGDTESLRTRSVPSLGLDRLDPAWLGANIVTRGIPDLSKIPTSSRLFMGPDLVVVVHYENFPCGAPGGVIGDQNPGLEGPKKAFVKHARGLRGLVGWVERVGSVTASMDIRVVPVSEVVNE